MEILSPVHGKFTYEDKEIIKFTKAIPGFEGLENFIIKEVDEESAFKIMQSLEDASLGFVLISPFDIKENYEVKLSEDLIKRLEIKEPTDVALYSMVTLNSKVENITANLRAPLVININSQKGEQFIIDKEAYKIKHPIMKG